MSLDSSVISVVLRYPDAYTELRRAGVTHEDFVEEYQKVWRFLQRMKRDHGAIPSPDIVERRYRDFELHKTKRRDLPILLSELRQRRQYMDFLDALDEASRAATTPDDIDIALSGLRRRMTALEGTSNGKTLIDIFGKEGKDRMIRDLKKRKAGRASGFPTGLKRFDYYTGGLQKQKLYITMARTGVGKSWINLVCLATAVQEGAKVGLYPLEMTVEETALRLYTIFSQRMFGSGARAIRNLDLTLGRFTPKKVVRLMGILEDQFKGQLYLADVGSLRDSYTVDRVEADQEIYHFDICWIDYLSLMRVPGARGADDWQNIRTLSNGCKGIAQRQDCVVGASAQVNREAMRVRSIIPRLEHISYGDSIGHDADGVISMGRKDPHLFYALVKNRGGPEIGRTRMKFAVNEGVIEETEDQDDDDDD